ncbi:MAG: L-2-hydroxyglutarate oxidase [Bacteroidia bacterium]|nr:L-2-hydroxyglutarate oxidase [Bacteroidia bacterium]MCF8447027.1 L-2-hydroxyglutarate oxidase [Bacteroidia bacterium]
MKYQYCIIGGGIVGLATAYQMLKKQPGLKLAVIEKEDHVAAHQTGHNSGVIHSGLYYKPGSLKAKNCIDGYQMLLDFCNEYEIPYELCGKLVVATSKEEIPELEKLYQRGLENGLTQITRITQKEANEIEPHLKVVEGMKVPYTGIIDYSVVCEKLAELVKEMGGEIYLNHKVEKINLFEPNAYIETAQKTFVTDRYINCAGLYSDKVAALTQKNIDTRIIPFRGEYYMLKPEKRSLVKNLIYPVPDPNFPFLGVHFTRMIDGGVEAGPNAVFAFKREGYQMSDVNLEEMFESLAWPGFRKVMGKYWKTGLGEFHRSFSKGAFTKALQKLIPEVQEDDLIPAEAGVRAQACDKFGGLIDDFKIIEEKHAIHILNAPSPAATSSLSIGNTIALMALK